MPEDNGRTSDTAGSQDRQDTQQDAQPSGTDDADVAPSGDSGVDLEGDDGVTAARASSSASESVEIVEIYDDNSGDEEEPRCGDKRKCTGVSKPPPLKAHEIKLVLDEWKRRQQAAEASPNGKPPSKGSLLKWVQIKLQRPSLLRNKIKSGRRTKTKHFSDRTLTSSSPTCIRYWTSPRDG